MMRRLDASVGQKLAVGFGIVIVLVALLGGVAIVASERVKVLQDRQTAVLGRADAADALEIAVLNTAVAARNYVLTRAAAERTALDRAIAALARRHEVVAAMPSEPADRALVEALALLVADYPGRVDAFVRIAGPAARESVRNDAEREAAAAREALLDKLRAYGALQTEKAVTLRAEVAAATGALVSSIGAVAVLVLLSGGLSAILVARSVRNPARRIVTAANAMRAGDFAPALDLQAAGADRPVRNELLEAATVFGRMAFALRDREARLGAQARLAAVLAANLSPIEVANDALRELTSYVGAEVGVIYVAGSDGEPGDLLRPLGSFALTRRPPPVRIGDGVAGQAAADQRTYVVQDIPADTPYVVDLGLQSLRPRSVAAVPMTVGKRVFGVLVIGAVRGLSSEAVAFLEESASQVAVSIDNALSHAHIENLAERLQEQNERLHAQNEELQAQGEELQAQSEELQAQNEELQAQGEELQAQADELRAQRNHLEDRNARLADAEAHRDRFFAVLGHELRNPLSVIATATKVLSGGASAEAETAARAIIERQIWRLRRLLDDLLDTARLSSGKIVLARRPIDLAEAARQAVETFSKPAQPAPRIQIDARPVWVDADDARIEQIITNLVGNALKYTPAGGSVTVSTAADGDTAVLRVVDTGLGIRPEFLSRVFEPFTQDELDRSGGLGLGLTLVKELVELHGGTVTATSPGRGQGTTIEVRLPTCPAPAPPSTIAPPGPLEPPPCSVLIVEDNADARMMLVLTLARDGHVVHEASDGPSGTEAAALHDPDVALIDLDLPGFDGYEVARRLRRAGRERPRLIAVSGYGRPEDRQRALEAGFDDHLVKPVDLDRVTAMLRSVPPKASKADPE
jgi:signal transduction histidine kinase/CheY-like chemotaxis protein/CHASE3 domain sensor protein